MTIKTARATVRTCLAVSLLATCVEAGEKKQPTQSSSVGVGTLRVITQTTGANDGEDLSILIDSIRRNIPLNGEFDMERPAPRKIKLAIFFPSHCRATNATREVLIEAGETAEERFEVDCASDTELSEGLEAVVPIEPQTSLTATAEEAPESNGTEKAPPPRHSIYKNLGGYEGIAAIVEAVAEELSKNLRLSHYFPQDEVPEAYRTALRDLVCWLSSDAACSLRIMPSDSTISVTWNYQERTLAKPVLFTVVTPSSATLYALNDGSDDFATIRGLDLDTSSWKPGGETQVRDLLEAVHRPLGIDKRQFEDFIVLLRDALREREDDTRKLGRDTQDTLITRIRSLEDAIVTRRAPS